MSATHGWWCNTKTIPLNCNSCGEAIFWFSCDCGSSILFDELGWPWIQHRCAGAAPKPTLSRLGQEDLSDRLVSHIDDDVAEQLSRQIDENIERDYVEAIQQAAKKKTRPPAQSPWITRQDPYHDCRARERGIITELIRNANIRKKAGVADSSLRVAELERFASNPLVQITIHTMALAEDESENCSFTFFIEENIVDELQLFKGSLVVADLRGIVIVSRFPIWVCDKLVAIY
ncbi:MAG: hypothetical protein OXG60_20345 [Chloroflexi bacterium]|nr:hypothetical protein [Chloroflexota bacterium]